MVLAEHQSAVLLIPAPSHRCHLLFCREVQEKRMPYGSHGQIYAVPDDRNGKAKGHPYQAPGERKNRRVFQQNVGHRADLAAAGCIGWVEWVCEPLLSERWVHWAWAIGD